MSKQLIIGLAGVAGSGKSSAAAYLSKRRAFAVMPFALQLKLMVAALGVPRDILYGDNVAKETPHPALNGLTPRVVMQRLGSEFRAMDDGFWVKKWLSAVAELPRVVCDDIRYKDEADAVRSLGGIIVRLERKGAGSKVGAAHSSEQMIGIEPDITVTNDGTRIALGLAMDDVIDELNGFSMMPRVRVLA